MDVVYALEDMPAVVERSVFLAGPTPRRQDVVSWRPQALELLDQAGYDGVVFVPEDRSGVFHGDYDGQISWEERCLEAADVILFWVPRQLPDMPAFTTNVEWGRWYRSGKVVFGAPYPDKPHKNKYLRQYAEQFGAPSAGTLEAAVASAVQMAGPGMARQGGERDVPLMVWSQPSFQRWYAAQQAAGNRLDGARVLWTFSYANRPEHLFSWVLQVRMWVSEEGRHKTNEFVFGRPDAAAVMLYRRRSTIDDSEVVLVREFRSPARTDDGFVWELPGGSSITPRSPRDLAVEELTEEAGMHIDPDRLVDHDSRQVAATLASHHAHLFSCEITEAELEQIKAEAGRAGGVQGDSELTYLHVLTVAEIRARRLTDWTTLGMILDVLSVQ